MKICLLLILFTLLGRSFGQEIKCFVCGFDEDDPEKECAVNPAKDPTDKLCIISDSCITMKGQSKTESGTKEVEYRTCGGLMEGEDLDADNCKDETRGTLDLKTCYCQGELCNEPGSDSGLPGWVWIVIALVVVLIIGAIVALIIWKLKSGESSKKIPETEAESVPLKSQEPTKTDGEEQKSQETPNDVP